MHSSKFFSPAAEIQRKILFLGPTSEGTLSKVNLISTYVGKENTISTVGVDFQVKTIKFEGIDDPIKAQLWDTAGQERLGVTTAYTRNASAIIIAIDISQPNWEEHIERALQSVASPVNPLTPLNKPFFLVGMTADGVAPAVDSETFKNFAVAKGFCAHSILNLQDKESVKTFMDNAIYETIEPGSIPKLSS
jgi:GTPase SAR1 family protein